MTVRTLRANAGDALRTVAAAALDLLFPPRCVSCKRRGAWFCTRCRSAMSVIEAPYCQRCGQSTSGASLCAACQRRPPAVSGLRAVAYLDGGLRQAIHAFKYNGVRALAQPLGETLADGYRRYALNADLIVPVPLHAARLNERGFNQALLLARRLGVHTGQPVSSGELARTRETPSQIGLSARDRHTNVQGAFAWQGGALHSRRVLLIDDVCTTGATMEACAAPLFAAGAASVWGLTLARERWHAQATS